MMNPFKTFSDAMHAETDPVPPGYVPPTIAVSYRWSYTHLISFLMIGFAVFWVAGTLGVGQAEKASFGLIFLLVGIWLQLRAWNEKIVLSPSGIESVDWLGRPGISATLTEIIGTFQGMRGSLGITTTQGTINILENGRAIDLFTEVRKIVRMNGQV